MKILTIASTVLVGLGSSMSSGFTLFGVSRSVLNHGSSLSFYKDSSSCDVRSALKMSEGGSFTETMLDMSDVGIVLLAGGTGSRMKANMPKQFLELKGQSVLQHSLDLFLDTLPAAGLGPAQVVLVMDPKYQPEYQSIVDQYEGKLVFAHPGNERQGAVENGLNKLVEKTGE